MTTATNGGVSLHYQTDGDGETVAFVGDAGYGAWQWGWQHAAVAGPFESLVYDQRGVGRSDAPEGSYTVGELAQDLEVVLADHGVRKAHLVGAGLGGMVALQTALSSNRVASLTLVATAATGAELGVDSLRADPRNPEELRRATEAALSAAFVERHPDVVDRIVTWRADEDASPRVWDAQTTAVERFDASDRLYEITAPSLVLHGTADSAWPVERGRRLADDLPRGTFEAVDGAGHLVGVETSKDVNDRLLAFLEEHSDVEYL
ncbi:alpha/beta fold hydrolase [Haloprofundus halophilus]|uniref:alpha/beta fold hydrolase n=1 Tax=Haloprofundus halophilus TaxID=2283527 RepID=UPI000E446BF2|nr:alpha/beta hydrolase [Haloprofundus halophilus]